MKRIFFCFFIFCVMLLASAVAKIVDSNEAIFLDRKLQKINETIQHEVQQIQYFERTQGITDEVLWLYNDLGISLFFKGEYRKALDTFEYILEKTYDEKSLLIGAALWGSALCHACLDLTEKMTQDLKMLEDYFENIFKTECQCKQKSMLTSIRKNDYKIHRTAVEFEYPNENISAAECRDRVTGSADALKFFVTPLIRDIAKRAIFNRFIDALEREGRYCCRDGSIWTTCVCTATNFVNTNLH